MNYYSGAPLRSLSLLPLRPLKSFFLTPILVQSLIVHPWEAARSLIMKMKLINSLFIWRFRRRLDSIMLVCFNYINTITGGSFRVWLVKKTEQDRVIFRCNRRREHFINGTGKIVFYARKWINCF